MPQYHYSSSSDRIDDTVRFYALLANIRERTGGYRTLSTCDGRMSWPRRGVYFFFEDGEERSTSGHGGRVVRIGTHALKPGSGTSLWNRLSQHRGARSGTGNHRGSIFRLLVGAALAQRGDAPLPASWGVGGDAGAAARKLGTDRAEPPTPLRADGWAHSATGNRFVHRDCGTIATWRSATTLRFSQL